MAGQPQGCRQAGRLSGRPVRWAFGRPMRGTRGGLPAPVAWPTRTQGPGAAAPRRGGLACMPCGALYFYRARRLPEPPRDRPGAEQVTQGGHISTEPRINERIRVPEVRLVGPAGEQVGIVSINDALRLAQESDLDLVEVAPTARPPVCKLMDYGKFKYESALKARESRKHQAQTVIKEIKLRPKIDPHDYGTKKGHVERFLRAGDKVKVTIMFRGREQSRPELGFRLLQRLAGDVEELGFVEAQAKQDGRNMIMVLGPHRKKPETKPERPQRTPRPEEPETEAAPAPSAAASPATDAPARPAPSAPARPAPSAAPRPAADAAPRPAPSAAPRPAADAPARPAAPRPAPSAAPRPAADAPARPAAPRPAADRTARPVPTPRAPRPQSVAAAKPAQRSATDTAGTRSP
jgi:translation initiation factor IF-3